MSKLVNLTMFRGYVNRVLPTVYDDSLSYYEVLAKVMEKINEIINLDNAQNEIINNIPEDVSEFAEDLAQFKSSMTQQFNDFKTEINADFDAFEDEVNAKIAADTTPTQGSTKLVTSGGVYASLQDIINSLVKDAHPTQDSENYVTSGGVWTAINNAVEDLKATLATKQNVLTWDTTPTANSTNPVQSGGIKSYVDNAAQAVQNNLDSYITNNNNRAAGIEGDITDLETGKQDALTFDLAPTLGSNNPVTSNGIAQAIAGVTPSIEVDPVPTQGSTNPVSSNGVFTAVSNLETHLEEGLADKQDTLTWDTTPTKNSQNPVTSGGLFEKFAQIDPYGTVDPEPEQGSPNAVSSGGTWTALQTLNNDLTAAINTKQDTLTFDSVPTENSENPVYSGGVFDGLAGKQDTLTFDAVPAEDSENPVYSGGVFAELALKADKAETAEYPIADSVSGSAISVTDSAGANVQALKVYGKSKKSKNIIPLTVSNIKAANTSGTWTENVYSKNDGTITVNSIDGERITEIVVNGTFSNETVIPLHNDYIYITGSYMLGCSSPSYSNTGFRLRYFFSGDGGGYVDVTTQDELRTLNDNGAKCSIVIPANTLADNVVFRPMICTAADYAVDPYFEPYGIISIGDSGALPITTANSDSSESSTATLTTGLPLCGIPVTQGETYTDETGQKWLADTADVEGVVNRVKGGKINDTSLWTWTKHETWSTNIKTVFTTMVPDVLFPNTPDEVPPLLCNQFESVSYNSTWLPGMISDIPNATTIVLNVEPTITDVEGLLSTYGDAEIYYPLATPTTTPLTAEEQQALLALRTFDSTTNLSITDSPHVNFAYLKNTENGEAITQLEDKINVELDTKQNMLTFDAEPTDSSTNPVTSGGVYTALAGKQDTLTWDNTPTEDSDNAISSGAVYNALQSAGGMQRTLLYTNTTPLVLPATITFGSDIRAYDVLQIEYTRFDASVNNTITPQYIEIPVDSLNTYYTDYAGIYLIGLLLPGIDTENVFYEINGLFTELTYDQTRSTLPTDITLNINRIFGVNYS